MKYLFFALLLLNSLSVKCQEFWSRSYDPFMHENEQITNIVINDSVLFVAARGTCLKDSIPECFKILKFDLEGNYLDGYEEPRFENGFGLEVDEEWIYVDGGNEPLSSEMKLIRISKDLSESSTLSASISNGYSFANRSCISSPNHIITYGSYRINSTSNPSSQVNGIQIWVKRNDFTIDTIVSILPTRSFVDIHDMVFDSTGFVFSIFIDKRLNEYGIERSYYRIIKQNLEGTIVWDYFYPFDNIRFESATSSIAVEKDKIFFTGFDINGNASVVCLDQNGHQLWEYVFEHDNSKIITPLDIYVKFNNNNILVSGAQRALANGWGNVGFISEIDKDCGTLVWERVYEIDKGEDIILGEAFSKFGFLRDIDELDTGEIIVGGELQDVYEDPIYGSRHDKDLWLVKLDSQGCLVENCGYLQSISNGQIQNDTCKWLKENANWFYSGWSNNPNQNVAQIIIRGDTTIGTRVCSILGIVKEGYLLEESSLVCFYEEVNELVYFYENDTFKLLYDFSFSLLPGDTVEYFLPSNFQYYDISSSQGAYKPSDVPYKYLYIDQEWVDLPHNERLRVLETQAIPNANEECFEMGRIIDGIGSEGGLLGKSCEQLTIGWNEFFRCFESDRLNYSVVNEGCLVTSVSDQVEVSVQIYPNPTKDYLTIESGSIEIVQINIFSLLGKNILLQNESGGEIKVDVSSFAEGVYWFNIQLRNGVVFNEKVIIHRN